MSQKPITIAIVSDDHYVILLAALLKSIEINHHSMEKIEVFVIDDGISKSNKEKILASISSPLLSINWVKMKDIIPDNIKLPTDNSSFPLNIYARLFIPYFISKDIEKVIYLDVDMLVLDDIFNLWNIDIENDILAAVVDRVKTVSNSWGGIKNYKELGIAPETKYFNSGLLLINPIRWRNSDITRKVINCVEENKEYAGYPDQYGLNVVLANKWLELDPLWNNYSIYEENDPKIIHFIGRKPIYKTYSSNPEYKEEFYKYLNLTAWKNFKEISEPRRYLKKILNVLTKKIGKL